MRIVLAVSAAFLAVPALAQSTPRAPRSPEAGDRRDPGPPKYPQGGNGNASFRVLFADSITGNDATLGMTLTPTGSKRDTLGVFVERVVPGGPAERAGIIEGERIVSLNGADLRLAASDVGDRARQWVPARRAGQEMHKITAGKPVEVHVYAGGRVRTVTVATERMADVYKGGAFMNMAPLAGFGFNGGGSLSIGAVTDSTVRGLIGRIQIEQSDSGGIRMEIRPDNSSPSH